MSDRTLYDADIVAWSEEQVAALRRLAAELRPNSREVDFENIIEEIGDVGRSGIRSVESLLVKVLVHVLAGAFAPQALAGGHWRGEVRVFLADVRRRYTPAMRARLDLDALWATALAAAGDKLSDHGTDLPPDLPATLPFTLAEMIDPAFGWDEAVARLRALADR
jgi:hypothetical protein